MATYRVNYLHRGKWWVAWTDDVPGAVTQGSTLDEARDNMRDAISLMLAPVDVADLPKVEGELIREVIEL